MSELLQNIMKFFSSSIGTILLSAFVSIITAIITNQITDVIHIKRRKRDRLSQICREYEQESITLHKEFRDRIINAGLPNNVNSINRSSANAFKQKLTDDSELYKLLNYFSIDKSGLVNILQRYEKRDRNNIQDYYDIVDEIKEEFLKIDKQI